MKRLWVILGALAMVCALTVGTAEAKVVKRSIQIPWLAPNSAVPNGAFHLNYGTKPLASEAIDTTGFFNLQDASFAGSGQAFDNLVTADSMLVGWLVLYSDSTADGASTCTAVTATIDASGDGWDFATATTASGITTSDDPVISIPVYQRPTLDHQNLIATAPLLRVRFTTVTGILLACRAKFIYWADTAD